MQDLNRVDVNIGDKVLVVRSYSKIIEEAVIIGFTAKKIRIENSDGYKRLVYNCIKVNDHSDAEIDFFKESINKLII